MNPKDCHVGSVVGGGWPDDGSIGARAGDHIAQPDQPIHPARHSLRPLVHCIEFVHDDLHCGLSSPRGRDYKCS